MTERQVPQRKRLHLNEALALQIEELNADVP